MGRNRGKHAITITRSNISNIFLETSETYHDARAEGVSERQEEGDDSDAVIANDDCALPPWPWTRLVNISTSSLSTLTVRSHFLLGLKKPLKRRRLNDYGSLTPENCLSPSQPLPLTLRCGVVKPCSCCNRGLSSKPGSSILCARFVFCSFDSTAPRPLNLVTRCGQLTCNICSRTCTHLPPSPPITPMLSYSPTPPCTPLSPLPLRLAVTFQSAASAVAVRSPRVTSKQRKRREFDGGSNPNDNQHMAEDFFDEPANDGMIIDGHGCGRKVCRNCSFENPQRCVPLPILSSEFEVFDFSCTQRIYNLLRLLRTLNVICPRLPSLPCILLVSVHRI